MKKTKKNKASVILLMKMTLALFFLSLAKTSCLEQVEVANRETDE